MNGFRGVLRWKDVLCEILSSVLSLRMEGPSKAFRNYDLLYMREPGKECFDAAFMALGPVVT